MGGLFLSGNAIFSSLGAGAVLVVAVAVLGSITVLPAVLARLGRWVDRPMVAVFSIFATLSTLDFKQLGMGLGAASRPAATVVRAVLLPSVRTLLGRWTWWAPRLLRRRALPPAPQPGRPLPAGGEPAVGPVRVGAGAR